MNKKDYYKLESTKGGTKVCQIIDGWIFETIVPNTIPIIIKESDKDTMICGLCAHYDSDMGYCEKHLNWGELVEMDTCDDYKECD